jgi:hypothetical protein
VQPEAWTGPTVRSVLSEPGPIGRRHAKGRGLEVEAGELAVPDESLMTQRARGGPRPRLSVPMIAEANEAPARISVKKCWTTQSTSTFHGPRLSFSETGPECMHAHDMRTEVTGFGARVLAHKITTKNFLLGLY